MAGCKRNATFRFYEGYEGCKLSNFTSSSSTRASANNQLGPLMVAHISRTRRVVA